MKGRKEYLLVASDKHICIHYLVSLLTDALHDSTRPPPGRGVGAKGTDRSDESANRSNSVNLWTGEPEMARSSEICWNVAVDAFRFDIHGSGSMPSSDGRGRQRGDHFHLLICPALPLPLSRRRQSMLIAALFRHVPSLAVASLQLRSHFPSNRNSARHQKQRGGAGEGMSE